MVRAAPPCKPRRMRFCGRKGLARVFLLLAALALPLRGSAQPVQPRVGPGPPGAGPAPPGAGPTQPGPAPVQPGPGPVQPGPGPVAPAAGPSAPGGGYPVAAGTGPGGGACGAFPAPPCQSANGLPTGGIPPLAQGAISGVSSSDGQTYMAGMQAYAAAYAAAGTIGSAAQALGNAALMLNGGGYNASYQATQRAAFASTMTSSLQSAGPPGSPADMYTAAEAYLNLADPSTMTHAAATSALSGLAILAAQPPSVMNSTCLSTTASALGAVIGAAFNYRSSAPTNATASFKSALGVLATLSTSQAAGLSLGSQQDVSSDYYSMTTRVDSLSSANTGLFASALAAPNTTASFDALPSGVFGSTSGNVSTTVISMSFDPYGTDLTTVSAVTRLSFSASNATLGVSGLSTALTFSLPALSSTTSGNVSSYAQCIFYNETTGDYAADGCVTLPTVYPAGVTVAWGTLSGLTSDADLAGTWTATGTLTNGCSSTVLDCSTLAGRATVIRLDGSSSAAGYGFCAGRRTGGVRIFHGANCSLYSSTNSAGCYWDATSQAFIGSACTVSTATTKCACRHATDFASAPIISVLSTSDLVSFDAAMIVKELKFLFIIVVILFAGMHILSVASWGLEARATSALLRKLHTPECGHARLGAGGDVDVWHFTQAPLEGEVDAVRGSYVEFAAVAGLPYGRLRCAVPEELLSGGGEALRHVVGRRAGLDPRASAAVQTELSLRMNPKARASMTKPDGSSTPRASMMLEEAAQGAEALTHEHFMSTALVLAFLEVKCLLPFAELQARRAAASALFAEAGVTSTLGSLDEAVATLHLLFFKSSINCKKRWLECACLWRLRLLAGSQCAGFWDATPGIALALGATRAPPPADDSAGGRLRRQFCCTSAQKPKDDDGDGKPQYEPQPEDADPLNFGTDAIADSMPSCLQPLAASAPELAARAWCTACVGAKLRTLRVSWLLTPGRTLVDSADEWAAAQPELKAFLPELERAAELQIAAWAAAQDVRIGIMRTYELSLPARAAQNALRYAGDAMLSLLTKHATFSVITSPFVSELRRWQKVCSVVSCGIALLVVDIWFYESHASNCCKQVRLAVGCDDDVYSDCALDATVYTGGQCADLVTASASSLDLPSDFSCTAFPRTSPTAGHYRDSVLVALIAVACALPVKWVLAYCFEASNELDVHGRWLRWSPFRAPFMGRTQWRFARERTGYLATTVAQQVSISHLVLSVWLGDAVELLLSPFRALLRMPRKAQGADSVARQWRYRSLAMCCLYACWAIFTWLIFSYGALLYRLSGSQATASFTKAWGISYGIDQGTQWLPIASTAVGIVAFHLLLDQMRVVKNALWFEDYLDVLSVQATLYREDHTTWWQRVRRQLSFVAQVREA